MTGMRWSDFIVAHLPGLALTGVIGPVVWALADHLRGLQVPPSSCSSTWHCLGQPELPCCAGSCRRCSLDATASRCCACSRRWRPAGPSAAAPAEGDGGNALMEAGLDRARLVGARRPDAEHGPLTVAGNKALPFDLDGPAPVMTSHSAHRGPGSKGRFRHGPHVFETRVAAAGDDVEQTRARARCPATARDLELVYDGTTPSDGRAPLHRHRHPAGRDHHQRLHPVPRPTRSSTGAATRC